MARTGLERPRLRGAEGGVEPARGPVSKLKRQQASVCGVARRCSGGLAGTLGSGTASGIVTRRAEPRLRGFVAAWGDRARPPQGETP